MARCGLPEAGAAGALQRHTGGQALGTEPGLAQASRNNAAQGCGGRQLALKAGGGAGTVRGGSRRPRFSGLRRAGLTLPLPVLEGMDSPH